MLRLPGKRHRCREAREQLSSYLDDEIEARDRRRLTRHLAHCSNCRKLLTNLSRTVASLRRVGERAG